MSTSARASLRSSPMDHADTPTAEQLTLLAATETPARFRLSRETRERGLRHVAEIRQMLAARADAAPAAEIARQPQHRAA